MQRDDPGIEGLHERMVLSAENQRSAAAYDDARTILSSPLPVSDRILRDARLIEGQVLIARRRYSRGMSLRLVDPYGMEDCPTSSHAL